MKPSFIMCCRLSGESEGTPGDRKVRRDHLRDGLSVHVHLPNPVPGWHGRNDCEQRGTQGKSRPYLWRRMASCKSMRVLHALNILHSQQNAHTRGPDPLPEWEPRQGDCQLGCEGWPHDGLRHRASGEPGNCLTSHLTHLSFIYIPVLSEFHC